MKNKMIEILRELEAKATPGPWRYTDSDELIVDSERNLLFPCWGNTKLQYDYDYSDVLLVPNMRNALPKLLAVVEAAKEIDEILEDPESRKEIDSFTNQPLRAALAALEEEV
jgi:hypothetical protein